MVVAVALTKISTRDNTSFTLPAAGGGVAVWPESRVTWANGNGQYLELLPGLYRLDTPVVFWETSSAGVTTLNGGAGTHRVGHPQATRRINIRTDTQVEVFITRLA